MGRVGQSLALLKMVMDAKIETTNLIRQRLKEENASLRNEIDLLSQKQYVPRVDRQHKLHREFVGCI